MREHIVGYIFDISAKQCCAIRGSIQNRTRKPETSQASSKEAINGESDSHKSRRAIATAL